MPNRWLCKTEPTDYSFADLVKDKLTNWDGIKNALALIHLRKIRKGDEILIYHTGKEKAVVGIATAASDAKKDDTVDIAAVRALKNAVPLGEIRKNKKLKDLDLVRISRLSLMPVSRAQWSEILRLGR